MAAQKPRFRIMKFSASLIDAYWHFSIGYPDSFHPLTDGSFNTLTFSYPDWNS
jgi:hypothetical protein